VNNGIRFPFITCESGLLRVWVYKLTQVLGDKFPQSTLDVRLSNIRLPVGGLKQAHPICRANDRGLPEETSLDFFFENVPGGMRIVDSTGDSNGVWVPDNNL